MSDRDAEVAAMDAISIEMSHLDAEARQRVAAWAAAKWSAALARNIRRDRPERRPPKSMTTEATPMPRHAMTVNGWDVEFYDDGYPMWTTIKHNGSEIVSIHHADVRDLEYALSRIREKIREKLPDNHKHEA